MVPPRWPDELDGRVTFVPGPGRRADMHGTRVRAAWGVLAGAMVLTGGCASSPDIQLRNPQTGQTFTCSGNQAETGRWWDEMAKRTRDNCVKDLEGQGYVVVK